MEVFLPAILSDLLGRSISFLVQRYRQQRSVQDNLEKLQLVLLRAQVTVEEAEARHITNHAMLRQLDMLREGMYRGCYMLDTFTYRAHGEEEEACRHSSSSSFNPAKRLCLHAVEGAVELQGMVDSLRGMIANMKEFVVFLKGYPRICREPYITHLLLDKFMFGRQKEVEHVISFLLQAEACDGGASVLPIVGVARVGKSTLVDHVCHDERVRHRFSSIVLLRGDNLEDEHLADAVASANHAPVGAVASHRTGPSRGSTLVILDLSEDDTLDEGGWRRLRSSTICTAHGSKIIVTSRSLEAVQSLGTTTARPLELTFLQQDAYWYFFKALAFGSTNPEDHPRMAAIAMDISNEQKGSFIGANIAGSLLRANFDAHFWSRILKNLKEYTQKHRRLFGKHPHDLLQKNRPVYLWRLAGTSKTFLSYGCYQACPAEQDIPRITLQEVLSGNVTTPHGRFEALAWRSQIPPCYSYLMSCSVQTPPPRRKKRSAPGQLVT